jgi:hypothetical protein
MRRVLVVRFVSVGLTDTDNVQKVMAVMMVYRRKEEARNSKRVRFLWCHPICSFSNSDISVSPTKGRTNWAKTLSGRMICTILSFVVRLQKCVVSIPFNHSDTMATSKSCIHHSFNPLRIIALLVESERMFHWHSGLEQMRGLKKSKSLSKNFRPWI